MTSANWIRNHCAAAEVTEKKSNLNLNSGVMSSAFGCSSGVDRREAICCLRCAVLLVRTVLAAQGKAGSLF